MSEYAYHRMAGHYDAQGEIDERSWEGRREFSRWMMGARTSLEDPWPAVEVRDRVLMDLMGKALGVRWQWDWRAGLVLDALPAAPLKAVRGFG